MSHFAEIGNDNIVSRVMVAEQDFINSGLVGDSFRWIQTSYGGNFRKNYAGIGYSYDSIRDAFIPPKPFPSWVLNEDTCQWGSPVPFPSTRLEGGKYAWDEEITDWVFIDDD